MGLGNEQLVHLRIYWSEVTFAAVVDEPLS